MKSSALTRRAAALALAGLMTLSPLNVLAAAPRGDSQLEEIQPIVVQGIKFREDSKTLDKGEKPQTVSVSVVFNPGGANKPIPLDWTSSDPGIVTVEPLKDNPTKAVVTPVSPGETTITASVQGEPEKKDTCTITVSGLKMEKSELDLFVNQEESLSCLRFGSLAAAGVELDWTSSNISVADVDAGRITAHLPGTAVITAKDKSGVYEAKCTVTVKEDVAEVVHGSLDGQRLCSFSSLVSTLNQRSLEKTGSSLVCLSGMSVPASQGLLTHGYLSPEAPGHGVGGSEKYYVYPAPSEKKLSDITFVPAPGFSGTAVISYTGYGEGGTPFFGKIQVPVAPLDDVVYNTTQGHPASFSAEDFQNVCRARTGRSADYLMFEPPAASQGTLYINYSVSGQYAKAVNAGDKIRAVDTESGEMLSFVPAENFSGTVTIPYRCINNYGGTFAGKVTITVQKNDGSELVGPGDVEYSTRQGDTLRLSGYDFNTACHRANSRPLRYVRFTSLPDQSIGTFYYDYNSNNQLKLNTSISYYYDSTPSLSRITFVPRSDFRGEVAVPFVGTDSYGATFNGTLRIQVGAYSNPSGQISYRTTPGGTVMFQTEDFDWACRSATGNPLESVRFKLPSWRSGRLYYNGSYGGTQVSENTDYYRTGSRALLRDISFVSSGEPGTISIEYTGWSTHNQRFYGTVSIEVDALQNSTVRVFGSSLPIPLRTVDFQVACKTVLGQDLNTVRFTSRPSSYEGQLLLDGRPVGTYETFQAADRQLDRMTFVARAGFQGVVRIPYEGTSVQGKQTMGVLEVTVSNQYCGSSFYDMTSRWDWARPSVEFLRFKGVTNGCGNGAYCPARAISRAEYVVMVCQAFGFTSYSAPGFVDVPANSYYASAVAAARERGIISGYNGRFHPNDSLTRQDAVVILLQAMQSAGRGLPYASDSVLSRYVDGYQVSPYARPAMSAMVSEGIINGDAMNQLRPKAAISRAEIAVILHHALTH